MINYHQLGIIMIGLICMGAALGFERSLLPRMAVEVWDIHSSTTVLYLVSTFGASKAFANVFAGPLADRYGRKPTLILGFVLGLPVMPYVNIATTWTSITAMNILFGISQGLLGSALFFLLIDVMGPSRRGIAVGLGECTIYVSTAIINVVAGDLASRFGYRPVPFWVATMFAVLGLLSTGPLRDTLDQVKAEQDQQLTKITSTIRLGDNHEEDTEAVLRDMMEREEGRQKKRIATNVYKSSDNNSSYYGSSGEQVSLLAADQGGGGADAVYVDAAPPPTTETHPHKIFQKEASFTSPSDIRDLHKKLILRDRPTSSTTSSGGCEDQEQEDSVFLLSSPTYEVYESVDDSDMEDDSSHNNSHRDNMAKLKEWDDAIYRSIQQIPSTLKMVGQIPGSLVGCVTDGCHPHTNNNYHANNNNNDATANEKTPLVNTHVPPSYEIYESRSESDIESDDDDGGHDWDEVEEEVKTLYPSAFHLIAHILWNNPNYGILCLAGMTMNFKDGFAWGSFPLFFSQFHHLSDDHTDMLVAIYPLCWGFAQAFTGALSDIYGRSLFLLMGFGTCTIGTALFFVPGFVWGRPAEEGFAGNHILIWIISDVLLGLGTAMAYPALQAAVADEILPVYRGLGLGFYRFTRDMGYVVGALVCGSLTDILGYPTTFLIVSGVLGTSWLGIFCFYKPLNLG